MSVKLAGLGDLRLQVLKLNRRYENADAIGVASCVLSTTLVEAVNIDDFEGGDKGKFFNTGRVDLVAVEDSGQNLQVLVQRVEHEEGLVRLQRAEVLQEGFYLRDQDFSVLLFVATVWRTGTEFGAGDKQFELLNEVSDGFYKLVAFRLGDQIVNGEAATDDIHETFVEFGRNGKETLVVIASERLQRFCLRVEDHVALLLVEEEPDPHHRLQMVLHHLVEVRLRAVQLFLPLLFEHLEVEAKEALDSRSVLQLEVLHIRV